MFCPLFIFSKKTTQSFIDLFYSFSILCFIYFYSDLYLFPSANFALVCSFSSSSSRCKLGVYLRSFLFPNVGIHDYKIPSESCFSCVLSIWICCVPICICFKVCFDFFFDPLVVWECVDWFPHICESSSFSSCYWCPVSCHCGQERYLIRFQPFKICWDLLCDLTYDPSWRMFHSWEECIVCCGWIVCSLYVW